MLQRIYFLETDELPACLQALYYFSSMFALLEHFVGIVLAGHLLFYPFVLRTEWRGLLFRSACGVGVCFFSFFLFN